MRLKNLSWIMLAFVLTAALPSGSQANSLRQLDPLAQQKAGGEDSPRRKMERDMAKKANEARQADLRRDTEKLLKLATELKGSAPREPRTTFWFGAAAVRAASALTSSRLLAETPACTPS